MVVNMPSKRSSVTMSRYVSRSAKPSMTSTTAFNPARITLLTVEVYPIDEKIETKTSLLLNGLTKDLESRTLIKCILRDILFGKISIQCYKDVGRIGNIETDCCMFRIKTGNRDSFYAPPLMSKVRMFSKLQLPKPMQQLLIAASRKA